MPGVMAITRVRRRAAAAAIIAVVGIVAATATAGAAIHPGSYDQRLKSGTVPSGDTIVLQAHCPAGDRIVTGGAYWHESGQNGDASLETTIIGSAPTANARGWSVTGANLAGASLILTVLADCLPSGSVGAYSVQTSTVSFAESFGRTSVKCPAGQEVVAGGAALLHPELDPTAAQDLFLQQSYPNKTGKGWYASAYNGGTTALDLKISALCRPTQSVGTYKQVVKHVTVLDDSAADDTADVYVHCPSGKHVVTGGAFWSPGPPPPYSPTTGYFGTIENITPTGDGTYWYVAGKSDDGNPRVLTVIALCLPS